jgi:hypothetical protein
MTIDPVIMLAEDIRSTEAALDKAAQLYSKDHRPEDGELVNLLLGRMKRLYHDLHETVPTSALGAGELVRMAARRLPFSHSRYSFHLHEIADRLSVGRRIHTDLVWLRALEAAMGEGDCGKDGRAVAPWLHLAVIGASRPVMVFRSVRDRAEQSILEERAGAPGHGPRTGRPLAFQVTIGGSHGSPTGSATPFI